MNYNLWLLPTNVLASLTVPSSSWAGCLPRPWLAALHSVPHHGWRHGALSQFSAQIIFPACLCLHLAGQDTRLCRYCCAWRRRIWLHCIITADKSISTFEKKQTKKKPKAACPVQVEEAKIESAKVQVWMSLKSCCSKWHLQYKIGLIWKSSWPTESRKVIWQKFTFYWSLHITTSCKIVQIAFATLQVLHFLHKKPLMNMI